MQPEIAAKAQQQLAERIGQRNDRCGNIPSDELVAPIEEIELSVDVKGILSNKQRQDLEEILNAIREVNNGFVGDKTIEAEVDLCISDISQELFDRCNSWFAEYVDGRLLKRNHRDNDSPSRRFDRLYCELVELFSPLFNRTQSLGYLFFDEPEKYATFRFFQTAFAPYIADVYASPSPKGPSPDQPFTEIKRFFDEANRADSLLKLFGNQYGWHLDRFLPFFESVAESSKTTLAAESHRGKSSAELFKARAFAAAEIRTMRPLLAGGSPTAFISNIGGKFVGMQWSLRFGIATLCIGNTREDVVRNVNLPGTSRVSLPIALIRHDGSLADIACPWITTSHWKNPDGMLLNVALLESVRDSLSEKYWKIDWNEIRNKGRTGKFTPEEVPMVLAVASHDIELLEATDAETIIESVEERGRRARINTSIKRSAFLARLTRFGCRWISGGNGSHTKIIRDGYAPYPLGYRLEYNPYIQRKCLTALGIAVEDWVPR